MPSREDGSAGEFFTGEIGSCRPLPPHPDVEFERKRAKRLLKDARAGDAHALRTMALVADGVPRDELQLELAQLAVAREYGFSSWTKLVQYYERWRLLTEVGEKQAHERQFYVSSVKWLMNGQAQRIAIYGQQIATFLPRLFGKRNEDVFASPISEDEARFVIARGRNRSSWDELLRHAHPDVRGRTLEERRAEVAPIEEAKAATPEGQAYRAMREGDLDKLAATLKAHPELRGEFESVYGGRTALMRSALIAEHRDRAKGRPLVDWLIARGAQLQPWLNQSLMYGWGITPDSVDYWVHRGADPDWIAPNGYSVLEHALIRYNIGQSAPATVDALRRHVKSVPQAFWVAAGVGDVRGVANYLDSSGRLTKAARDRRPDLAMFGLTGTPFNPDADDETIIFEAFWIAAINERTNVLAEILDRGFPIDAAPFNSTTLHMAVGCAAFASCEFLLSRGADPDAPQFSNRSPRWMATEVVKDMSPETPESYMAPRRRIAELLAAAPPK